MYAESRNALKFKALRDIWFCGFLWTVNYRNNDFDLKAKWRINEEEIPRDYVEFPTCTPATVNPETELHHMMLHQVGFKPVLVQEG